MICVRTEPLHTGAAMIADEPPSPIHFQAVPLVALVHRLVEQRLLFDDVLHRIQDLRGPEHRVLELKLIIHEATHRCQQLRGRSLSRPVPWPICIAGCCILSNVGGPITPEVLAEAADFETPVSVVPATLEVCPP